MAASAHTRPQAPAPTSASAARWIRATLVAGYLGVIALCWLTPWGPRVFWTMALPLVPIGIVLMGFHHWRRICPLAFWGELGQNLPRTNARRPGGWLERWFFLLSFGFLVAMLSCGWWSPTATAAGWAACSSCWG